MSDVGAIKAGLEATKRFITEAPYQDAGKAFNGLEITGADVFKAQLGKLASNLDRHEGVPGLVYAAAGAAWSELASTQESDEGMQPTVSQAFDHLGVMEGKAQAARGRAAVMCGLAEKAVGLYAEFMATMEEFDANRVEGEKELNESAQSAQLAIQSIDTYNDTL